MNRLIEIITSDDDQTRDQSLESVCRDATLAELLDHITQVDEFRRSESNLYYRVRALFFLAAIYRYHLPPRLAATQTGLIPFEGYEHLLSRRFIEAIDCFRDAQNESGPTFGLASALAQAYHELGFQTLADQVRRSVRTVRGNQWMFRLGHPADHPCEFAKNFSKQTRQPEPCRCCARRPRCGWTFRTVRGATSFSWEWTFPKALES